MFIVSARTSTNTNVAPANTNEFAVDEKVKDGRITSSPGFNPQRSAAISSALEPEVVSRAFLVPNLSSNHASHFLVKGPSPQIFKFETASFI